MKKAILASLGVFLIVSFAVFPQAQDFKKVEKDFKDAIVKKDPASAEENVKKVISFNDEKAVKLLIEGINYLQAGDDNLYWIIVKGLAAFTSKESLQEISKYIISNKTFNTARDILFTLQSNTTNNVAIVLNDILGKGTDELKLMAIDHMVTIQNKNTIQALIDALKKEGTKDSEVKRRVLRALCILTKQDFGEDVKAWQDWWNIAKDKDLAQDSNPPPGSTGTAVDNLDKGRQTDFEKLQKEVPKDSVVVLKAGPKCKCDRPAINYDSIESILEKMKIPHIVVTKEEFEKDDFKLDNRLALLINCNHWRKHCGCKTCKPGAKSGLRIYRCEGCDIHFDCEYKLSDNAIQKIRNFVTKSGYLFTEDWELGEVLERAFPGYVKEGEAVSEDTVPIQPKTGATSHPYLKRIFAKPPKIEQKPSNGTGAIPEPKLENISHTWKIDQDSPIISIVSNLITVLIVCSDLGKKYKDGDAVAITFGYGEDPNSVGTLDSKKMTGGRVLHVLSHFGKQKSQDDEYTLQNLILNFILEARERDQLKPKKKK